MREPPAVGKHPEFGKDSLLLTRPATKSILTRLSDISLRNLFPKKSNLSYQGDSNNPLNIELEITLRCNSKCPQCSRHCNIISYGDSDMTIKQINRLISQVLSSNIEIGHITVMGGEPTIHPHFEEITLLLNESLVRTQKVKTLEVATNGILEIPESILKLPIQIRVSPLSTKRHRCQFIAPKDTGQETRFCDVPYVCGIALNCYGYFPCGAGGTIARLFNMKRLIMYELPSSLTDFGDLKGLCSLCQASAVHQRMYGVDDPTPSKSFEEAIRNFKKRKHQFRYF